MENKEFALFGIKRAWLKKVFSFIIRHLSPMEPEFLVYNELLHTERPYIHGVTNVEPAWLVEHATFSCIFSEPLTDPRPFYDTQTDQVKCWVIPKFGPFCWQLSKHQSPVSNNDCQARVFTYAFLLKGQVCQCLKAVRKYMAVPPESVLKVCQWNCFQKFWIGFGRVFRVTLRSYGYKCLVRCLRRHQNALHQYKAEAEAREN